MALTLKQITSCMSMWHVSNYAKIVCALAVINSLAATHALPLQDGTIQDSSNLTVINESLSSNEDEKDNSTFLIKTILGFNFTTDRFTFNSRSWVTNITDFALLNNRPVESYGTDSCGAGYELIGLTSIVKNEIHKSFNSTCSQDYPSSVMEIFEYSCYELSTEFKDFYEFYSLLEAEITSKTDLLNENHYIIIYYTHVISNMSQMVTDIICSHDPHAQCDIQQICENAEDNENDLDDIFNKCKQKKQLDDTAATLLDLELQHSSLMEELGIDPIHSEESVDAEIPEITEDEHRYIYMLTGLESAHNELDIILKVYKTATKLCEENTDSVILK